jgi:hypothetical protein
MFLTPLPFAKKSYKITSPFYFSCDQALHFQAIEAFYASRLVFLPGFFGRVNILQQIYLRANRKLIFSGLSREEKFTQYVPPAKKQKTHR